MNDEEREHQAKGRSEEERDRELDHRERVEPLNPNLQLKPEPTPGLAQSKAPKSDAKTYDPIENAKAALQQQRDRAIRLPDTGRRLRLEVGVPDDWTDEEASYELGRLVDYANDLDDDLQQRRRTGGNPVARVPEDVPITGSVLPVDESFDQMEKRWKRDLALIEQRVQAINEAVSRLEDNQKGEA